MLLPKTSRPPARRAPRPRPVYRVVPATGEMPAAQVDERLRALAREVQSWLPSQDAAARTGT